MRKISMTMIVPYSIVKRTLLENNIEIDSSKRKKNNYILEGNIAKIELRRRNKESFWTIIDLEDLQRVLEYPYSWHAGYRKNTNSYYASTTIHKEHTTMCLNYFIAKVDPKSTFCVDHINHDTLDNRKENLRITEVFENSRYRKGKNKNNVSGYRNVMYLKRVKKKPYHVFLMVDGKNTCLGKFSDVHEAGAFAEEMRQKYYGEFAGAS